MVGTANGYHLMIKTTPPPQVCDGDAFADGVRYGYALTWNRLVGEDMRNGGKAKRKFDASAVHPRTTSTRSSGTARSASMRVRRTAI